MLQTHSYYIMKQKQRVAAHISVERTGGVDDDGIGRFPYTSGNDDILITVNPRFNIMIMTVENISVAEKNSVRGKNQSCVGMYRKLISTIHNDTSAYIKRFFRVGNCDVLMCI